MSCSISPFKFSELSEPVPAAVAGRAGLGDGRARAVLSGQHLGRDAAAPVPPRRLVGLERLRVAGLALAVADERAGDDGLLGAVHDLPADDGVLVAEHGGGVVRRGEGGRDGQSERPGEGRVLDQQAPAERAERA